MRTIVKEWEEMKETVKRIDGRTEIIAESVLSKSDDNEGTDMGRCVVKDNGRTDMGRCAVKENEKRKEKEKLREDQLKEERIRKELDKLREDYSNQERMRKELDKKEKLREEKLREEKLREEKKKREIREERERKIREEIRMQEKRRREEEKLLLEKKRKEEEKRERDLADRQAKLESELYKVRKEINTTAERKTKLKDMECQMADGGRGPRVEREDVGERRNESREKEPGRDRERERETADTQKRERETSDTRKKVYYSMGSRDYRYDRDGNLKVTITGNKRTKEHSYNLENRT